MSFKIIQHHCDSCKKLMKFYPLPGDRYICSHFKCTRTIDLSKVEVE